MFRNPQAVNPEQHGQLKLSNTPDYRYCAGEMATPFVSGEMWQIAREFITVFPLAADGLPLAILGSQRAFCSSVANSISVGPSSKMPFWFTRVGPSTR